MRAPRTIGDKLVISSVADANPISYPLAKVPQNYRYDDVSDQIEAQPNQPLAVRLNFHGGLAYSDYDERTAGAFVNDGMILHEPGIIRPPIAPTTVTLTDAVNPVQYFFETNGPADNIAYDAASNQQQINLATCTWNHTTGSGDDRIIIVGASISKKAGALGTTTATYDGNAMTPLVGFGGADGEGAATLFYYLNPGSGSKEIVVTVGSSRDWSCGAVSYTGVNQQNPIGTSVRDTGTSTTASLSVATAEGDMVVDCLYTDNQSPSVGGGQTERWNAVSGGGAPTYGAGSHEAATGTSVTMSWTLTSAEWYYVAIPLHPSGTLPRLYCIAIEDGEVNVYKVSLDADFGTLLNTKSFAVTPTQPMGKPAEFNDGSNTYWRLGLGDPSNRLQALTAIATGTSDDTWTASGDADARHLQIVGNELYRSTAENEISVCPRGSGPASEANWGDEFYAGDKSTKITELGEAGGFNYIAKEDGFYQWAGVGDPENVFPSIGKAERNGQGMVYWHGGFLIPTSSGLWWTLTGKPVGPDDNPNNRANDPSLGSTGYSKHGSWMGLAEFGEYVYVLYVSSAGNDAYLYYGRERDETDPPGWGPIIWHVLDRPTADFNDFHGCFITETSRFSASETRPCLWYAHGNDLRYIWLDKDGAPMSRRGDIDLGTSGVVTSGQNDFGVGQVKKQFNVIQGWAEDFGSVSGSFRFSVAIDGGSFANVGATITADGFFQRFWTQDSADTGRRMLARCTWIGSSSLTDTDGPHLRDVVIRTVAKPRTTRVWTFLLMAEDSGKTAKKVRSELEGYKNNLKKFKLPDSDTLNGVLTSLRLLRTDEIRDLTERNQTPPKFILEAKVREMLTA